MFIVLMVVCSLAVPFKECDAATADMVFRSEPVGICPVPFGYRRDFAEHSYLRVLCVKDEADRPGSGGLSPPPASAVPLPSPHR